jgi:RecB family exonuclease
VGLPKPKTNVSKDLLAQYGLRAIPPEAIDSSMLKDFIDCPSQFYLRHILGLRRKRRPLTDIAKFDWGTCWHKVMEDYWKTRIVQPEIAMGVALASLNTHYPEAIRPDTDKHGRSKERMIKMLFDYIEKIADEIDDIYETIRFEQFFDVFHEELGIRWCGRMDKWRRKRKTGELVIWDYKTTSAMGQTYFEQHEYGFQFPGYVWAANQISTSPVREAVIEVLYTLKASHQFYRRSFPYNTTALAEWTKNVKLILDQINYMIEHHLYEPQAWIQNRNHCTRWGMCTFTDIHFIPPEGDVRLRILEEDFTEDRWDPLAHSEEAV